MNCAKDIQKQFFLAKAGSAFSAGLLRTATDTPPGGADAFEGHQMLVRCPAPKRPPRVSASHHNPIGARARSLLAHAAGDSPRSNGGSST